MKPSAASLQKDCRANRKALDHTIDCGFLCVYVSTSVYVSTYKHATLHLDLWGAKCKMIEILKLFPNASTTNLTNNAVHMELELRGANASAFH